MASGGEKVLGSEYKLILDMVHNFLGRLSYQKGEKVMEL